MVLYVQLFTRRNHHVKPWNHLKRSPWMVRAIPGRYSASTTSPRRDLKRCCRRMARQPWSDETSSSDRAVSAAHERRWRPCLRAQPQPSRNSSAIRMSSASNSPHSNVRHSRYSRQSTTGSDSIERDVSTEEPVNAFARDGLAPGNMNSISGREYEKRIASKLSLSSDSSTASGCSSIRLSSPSL